MKQVISRNERTKFLQTVELVSICSKLQFVVLVAYVDALFIYFYLNYPSFDCFRTGNFILRLAIIIHFTLTILYSEIRIEGLETLDYLDNLFKKERFTEQGDAITFESEVNPSRLY